MTRKITASLVLCASMIWGGLEFSAPVLIPGAVVGLSVSQQACGPNTLEKLNTTLNQTAHALEAAIDTNGKLYAAGTYGAVGSEGAIKLRQEVAKAIHDSNEYLIQALNVAKTLTKETFEGRKIEVLEKLSLAATGLSVGNQTVDLVLQSVASLINQAVALVQLFHAGDADHMDLVIPKLNNHLKILGHVRELEACV